MSLYTVRVFKERTDQPTIKWANSYELSSGEANFESSEMLDIASALVEAETKVHLNVVKFTRVVISTWVPDSVPYDPNNLKTVDFSVLGSRSAGSQEKEALDTVLFIKRAADFGRSGKLFFRHFLVDSDVETGTGEPALSSAGSINATTALSTYITALSPVLTYIVMAGKSQISKTYKAAAEGEKQEVKREYNETPHIRKVIGFAIGGVKRVQLGHKYFDKES